LGTDGDAFAMSWTERDGPPVSALERRGFGTIVMERMVEGSLGGTVDLDYAPSGLTRRLTCPAGSTLEPLERSSSAWDRASLLEHFSVARRHVATGEPKLLVSAKSSLGWNVMATIRERRNRCLHRWRNFTMC